MTDLRREDFSYHLPEELIAQRPTAERTGSRLLQLAGATGQWTDLQFHDIERLLQPGDLLVLNDTRVIPARLHGRKSTGGAVEVLVERLTAPDTLLAQVRSSKGTRAGMRIELPGGASAEVTGRDGDLTILRFDRPVAAYLDAHGEMPLPPYITGSDAADDRERYQTVFAREAGAVAAPTAGLHFDKPLLERLTERGIHQARVTLHVGAGTFQPVRADRLADHVMHAEWLRVSAETVAAVQATQAAGGRVVAVGTTAVRSLETAAANGMLAAFEGETRLFLYPGYRFRVVDAMVTNFHLSESTLLMLVSAFCGREAVLAAYAHAVAARYRFFSYGDAMFLTPSPAAARQP
jgi:S-adenosylmethionine:tRNA ribosyltransferase-isomerase